MKKKSLLLLSLFALLTSCGSLPSFARDQTVPYDCFAPGDIYNDTDGNLIQAHGGQISQYTYQENGKTVTKYVWIGEDRKNGYYAEVNAYSSTDLYNWDFEGTILKRVPSMEAIDEDSYFNSLYGSLTSREREDLLKAIGPTSVIERPKLLYNAKNDNYVLWFHQDGYSSVNDYYRYGTGNAAVAVSDSIFGPYRFIASHRLNYITDGFNANPNSLGEARDMNLFLDDDNQAYIVYTSENNKSLFISRLNEDYTDLAVPASLAKEGKDFTRIFPNAMREAPVLTKYDGRYYLMSSSTTGWMSNSARVYSSGTIFGKYVNDGNPCVGNGQMVTFDTQSTSIFKYGEQYIYLGDRWNSQDLRDSRYVFLPITFEDAKMQIRYYSKWNLEGERI